VQAFARVYAQAISGIPILMDFDPQRRQFRLEWQLAVTIRQPTEVFIPEIHYPLGFRVYVSEGLKWTFDWNRSVICISNESVLHSKTVYVIILPKQ